MNSILFSANPKLVNMVDATEHLLTNDRLYFEVKFPILKAQFSFPMAGFIHIKGDKVRYVLKNDGLISEFLCFMRLS